MKFKIMFVLSFVFPMMTWSLPDFPNGKFKIVDYDYSDPNIRSSFLKKIQDGTVKPNSWESVIGLHKMKMRSNYEASSNYKEFFQAQISLGIPTYQHLIANYGTKVHPLVRAKWAKTLGDLKEMAKRYDVRNEGLYAFLTAELTDVDIKKNRFTIRYQDDTFAKVDLTTGSFLGASRDDLKGGCSWYDVDYSPYKLISGPGCAQAGTLLCVGWVVCDRNGLEVVRKATCSEKNCAAGKASQCAAEKAYSSNANFSAGAAGTSSSTSNSGGTAQ